MSFTLSIEAIKFFYMKKAWFTLQFEQLLSVNIMVNQEPPSNLQLVCVYINMLEAFLDESQPIYVFSYS